MRLAFVHDHLNQYGGAEKVLSVMREIYPEAPVYTLSYSPEKIPEALRPARVIVSKLGLRPWSIIPFKFLLPFMPAATEEYDLSQFDVVISNCSAFAKGVVVAPKTVHICYCHTPTRYLWSDRKSYLEEQKLPRVLKVILGWYLHWLRIWDFQAADRVDFFVANSETVRQRIKRYYQKDSVVIFPPVEVGALLVVDQSERDFFLAGGRLVPYKRIDLAIMACNRVGAKLKIFGTGPAYADLKKLAGPTVEFLGRISESEKGLLFAHAKAYLHPQEEDFGMTAVEAMAAGTPVLAYGVGGASETVMPGITGELFSTQTNEEWATGLVRFDPSKYSPIACKAQADKFSTKNFKEAIIKIVTEKFTDQQNRLVEAGRLVG